MQSINTQSKYECINQFRMEITFSSAKHAKDNRSKYIRTQLQNLPQANAFRHLVAMLFYCSTQSTNFRVEISVEHIDAHPFLCLLLSLFLWRCISHLDLQTHAFVVKMHGIWRNLSKHQQQPPRAVVPSWTSSQHWLDELRGWTCFGHSVITVALFGVVHVHRYQHVRVWRLTACDVFTVDTTQFEILENVWVLCGLSSWLKTI